MPTITPGVSNAPEPGPSAGGERIPDRTLRLRGKGHRRADSGNIDNELKGVVHRSGEALDHGSLRGGREDRR